MTAADDNLLQFNAELTMMDGGGVTIATNRICPSIVETIARTVLFGEKRGLELWHRLSCL